MVHNGSIVFTFEIAIFTKNNIYTIGATLSITAILQSACDLGSVNN